MTEKNLPPSLWQLKPWWCQPWSIVITGMTMPFLVWILFHRLWLVGGLGFLVVVWWYVFLYLVPKQYRESIETQL